MIYIDDILLISNADDTLKRSNEKLNNNFSMKTMGAIKWFLGIHIGDTAEGVNMKKTTCVYKVLYQSRITDPKDKAEPTSPLNESKKMVYPPE